MAKGMKRHGIFGSLWRLLTVAGVLAGASMLFGKSGEHISATGRPTTPPSRASVKAGHEEKDINVRGVAYILAGMGATSAVVVGVVFAMIWRFNTSQQQAWSRFTPQETARVVAPSPRVQADPFADLAKVRAREERLLHTYGWTSADHSTARIPIDRAMALMVGKSLDASP